MIRLSKRWQVFLTVIIVFLLAIVAWYVIALAETEQEEPVDVLVTVPGIFQISVYPSIIDFGEVLPGKKGDESAVAIIKTNYGNPWYLKLYATDHLYYDTESINIDNLCCKTTGGAGAHQFGANYERIKLSSELRYSAHTTEYANYPAGTKITTAYLMHIPSGQKPGLYTTTVIYLLTPTL